MVEVQASLILAIAQAALVTVAPGAPDECPSSAQVQSAMENRAPRLVAPRADEGKSGPLTLVLSPVLATGETSFFLLDRNGLVKLYRTMPAPSGDRAKDCLALADTVAFIVDRYFDEVEMPVVPVRKPPPPPPPPPPPVDAAVAKPTPMAAPVSSRRFALALDAGRRVPGAAEDTGGLELKLSGAARLARLGRAGTTLWLELAGGGGRVSWDWTIGNGQGTLTVLRTMSQASFLAMHPAWIGALYAGPVATAELLWIDASSRGHAQAERVWAGAVGLRAGYFASWRNRAFVRADLGLHRSLKRPEVFTESSGQDAILAAPSLYFAFGAGVGIWF